MRANLSAWRRCSRAISSSSAAYEVPVADDFLAADVEPVDAVRAGEDEAGDGIRGAAELEAVGAPDGEVGTLARARAAPMSSRPSTEAPPRVPSRRASRTVIAFGPAARAGDEQRLLDLEEEVAALVRRRAVDAEADADALRRAARARARCRRRAACSSSGSGRRRRRDSANFATSSGERCTQWAHQTSSASQPSSSMYSTGRAAELLVRVLVLLDGLGEVRVQAQAEPARELRRLAHQLTCDREGRARRDGDLDRLAVGERRRCLRRGEDLVAILDDVVGRQPAVGLAEIHRPARGDDSHAELARGADLRFEQAGHARREEVVVVEDRRAAGQRQLGQSGARGRVLRLLVDPRPHRIERLQPAEEVLVLGARPRQVLPEVMVRVHKARRHDGAAQVDGLVRVGTRAPANVRDDAVLDEQPAAVMLAAVVVHRHDVRVVEERAHTCERDELEAVDVDEAAVGDLQARDHRQAEERQRQERRRAGPAERARGVVAGEALLDHLRERRVGKQPCDGQRQLRRDLAAVDDDDAAAELAQALDRARHVRFVDADRR